MGRGRTSEIGPPAGHDHTLTRDRFDLFMQHCSDVGVTVEWEDLGPQRRGHCIAPDGRIVLNPRMTFMQAASTGVHEFAHWAFGDIVSTPAVERRAWEYGASLLVEAGEYAAAERLVGPDARAISLELGVTTKLVDAWRRWWHRQGHLRVDVSTLDLDRHAHDGP